MAVRIRAEIRSRRARARARLAASLEGDAVFKERDCSVFRFLSLLLDLYASRQPLRCSGVLINPRGLLCGREAAGKTALWSFRIANCACRNARQVTRFIKRRSQVSIRSQFWGNSLPACRFNLTSVPSIVIVNPAGCIRD